MMRRQRHKTNASWRFIMHLTIRESDSMRYFSKRSNALRFALLILLGTRLESQEQSLQND